MPGKILMIDDDPELTEAVVNLVTAKGYEIDTAANGEEGLQKARSIRPDLIILDVMMTTKTEGFDIARELHKDETLNRTPVVILTGIRREMSLPFGFEPDEDWLPVKQVIEKPLKPEVLLSVLSEHMPG